MQHELKSGAFTYKIQLHSREDGVVFDIIDNVIISGAVITEIIGSGKIDRYGRCKLDIFCDVHAAISLGDILKFAYDKAAELMIDDEL